LKENPRISIITVCFNAERTIEDTIKSVLSQDYPNLEYIVIDGKSTDDSLTVIKKFEDQISHVISEKDKGMYDGLNKGIEMASGEIIGMLNADDFYISPTVVSNIAQSFQEENADAAYADLYYVDQENTDKIVRKWRSGNYKRKKFFHGWMPPHPAFFIKKEFYNQYGKFNLDFKSAADYELMLRMLYKHKAKTAYLPKFIVKMRVGGMSNASLINRLRANREDKKAWKVNGLKAGVHTFLMKPMRKVFQYL